MSTRYPELLESNDEPFIGWTLLSFSIPESRRSDRHVLRSALARQGFGTVASGLWIRPDSARAPIAELVAQLGFSEDVNVFSGARYQGPEVLRSFAAQCWDLEALGEKYKEFIAAQQAEDSSGHSGEPEPKRAFAYLTTTHNQWRLLVQVDPRLPAEALPTDWAGHEARRIMECLTDRLHAPALDYVRTTLDSTGTRRKRSKS
jgi:phenylacetic acid degradation operon negative regulatory protein